MKPMARQSNQRAEAAPKETVSDVSSVTQHSLTTACIGDVGRLLRETESFLSAKLKQFTPDELTVLIGDLSGPEIDEKIKSIQRFLRFREGTQHELPDLPREALQQCISHSQHTTKEELVQLQERIIADLKQRYGEFDEGNLVLFLVKYRMNQNSARGE